ncbi:NUDIX hydrolase [Candidatus Saccharibacteria bacterium]|nr:NUDIX hydrolase [Candidatus Saccharibacteria bacterium]
MRTIYRDIVGAFIFSSDGKMLLGKSSRKTYEGTWIIPGGGVDNGETKLQALKRELLEELDLDISTAKVRQIDIDLHGESKKLLKDTNEEVLGKYTFFNFVIDFDKKAEQIELKELDDFVNPTWFDISELSSLPLPPPSITSLKKLGLL